MSAPYRAVVSQGQRLKADAVVAAEVRDYRTDPDVVALKVERARLFGDRFLWASMGILLVFAMVTVQRFVAHGAPPGSLEWAGAWFLEPGIVAGLVGVLIWESLTTRWLPADQAVGPWTRTAKWGLLGCTYVMNTAHSWVGADWYGVVAHSIPPIGVFVLTECRVEMLTKLERCVVAAHEYTQRRNAERAKAEADLAAKEAERQAAQQDMPRRLDAPVMTSPATPIGPAAPPAFRGVGRPDPAPAGRPEDTSREATAGPPGVPAQDVPARQIRTSRNTGSGPRAGRSGRRPTKRPRTDEQLTAQVRRLAEDNGSLPSAHQVKTQLRIGHERARRLLAQLDPTPAVPAASNGAATRKEHTP